MNSSPNLVIEACLIKPEVLNGVLNPHGLTQQDGFVLFQRSLMDPPRQTTVSLYKSRVNSSGTEMEIKEMLFRSVLSLRDGEGTRLTLSKNVTTQEDELILIQYGVDLTSGNSLEVVLNKFSINFGNRAALTRVLKDLTDWAVMGYLPPVVLPAFFREVRCI